MKKLLLGLILISALLLAQGVSYSNESDLYLSIHKEINGSWLAKFPAWDIELSKMPLIVDIESSLNYTMPRGGHVWNHHSIQTGINVGVEFPLTYKGSKAKNEVTSTLYATTSLDLKYIIAGNDDGLPEGMDLGNTTRIGIWNKF